jgi:hypothetical protein
MSPRLSQKCGGQVRRFPEPDWLDAACWLKHGFQLSEAWTKLTTSRDESQSSYQNQRTFGCPSQGTRSLSYSSIHPLWQYQSQYFGNSALYTSC